MLGGAPPTVLIKLTVKGQRRGVILSVGRGKDLQADWQNPIRNPKLSHSADLLCQHRGGDKGKTPFGEVWGQARLQGPPWL